MAAKVEMFRSTPGNLFDTEHMALLDDLRGMLIDSGAINDASAAQAVEFIASDTKRLAEFREMLSRIADTHPALQTTIAPQSDRCEHGNLFSQGCQQCCRPPTAPIGRCMRRDGMACECDLTMDNPFCNHWVRN